MMPFNLEAEERVVAACLSSPRALQDVSEILRPEQIYSGKLGSIYRACLDAAAAGEPVEVILLAETLQPELVQRMRELLNAGYPAANAAHHARLVAAYHGRRELIRAGQEIARLGWDDIPDSLNRAEQLVYDISVANDTGDLEPMRASLDYTYAELDKPGDIVTGTPTGLRDLDTLTAGLQPGNLVIAAARPGMGKSAIAINALVHNAIRRGKAVALFTLEMSKHEINQRTISQVSGIDLLAIRTRRTLTATGRRIIADARPTLERAPIHQDDTASLTLADIRSRARRLKARRPDLCLVVVDYLQLMLSERQQQTRNDEIAGISRGLKILARELETPVLALAQLNRGPELRHDKRPLLSDLRDSGAIEQDADLVIFLYRDDYYTGDKSDDPGVTELIVAKHRNGPTGLVRTRWVKERAEFQNLDTDEDDEEEAA